MSDLLIRMAKAAIEDKTLFAPYVQQYASQKALSWEDVAGHLQINREQLAKLALCSRPQQALSGDGMIQIANYVGMDRTSLNSFVAEVEGREKPHTYQMSGQLENKAQKNKSAFNWGIMNLLPKRRSWAVGVVILLILLLGTFVSAQPNSPTAATLVVGQGQATVIQANSRNASQEVTVSTDEALTISSGDQIFLTAASAAQLRLIDGSTVDLAAGTEINVDELLINDDGYRVHLRLLAGQTVNRVVTVLGIGDRFEISTPSSTASVRGTIFTVAYMSADETYISCDEGKVEVALSGQEESVIVSAGMEVTAVVEQPLIVKPQQALEPDIQPQPSKSTLPSIPTVILPVPAEAQSEALNIESEPEPVHIPVELLPIENGPNGIGPPDHRPRDLPNEVPGAGDGNGPPDSVPGHPPADPPGNGDPPEGGGDPPGQDNANGPPDSVPGNPPDDPPGNGRPPEGGGDPPGQGNGNGGGNNGNGNSA